MNQKFFFVVLWTFLCIFSGCSTVRLIEGKTFQILPPKFKEALEPERALNLEPSSDYKVREKTKKIPSFILLPIKLPENLKDPALRQLLAQELEMVWRKADAKKIHFSKKWDVTIPLEELRALDIDAIVYSEVQLNEEQKTFLANYTVKDPVNGKEYGTVTANGKILTKESDLNEKMKRVELFKNKNQYVFLHETFSPQIEFESKPSASAISEILKKSISANITVVTTSSDTILSSDGKEIGKLPLTNIALLDGRHVLEFSKLGKTPVKKEIVLRAGESKEIFHEWDDDMTLGAIKTLSFPPGLKVSWDGIVKGETPFFSNDLSPGDYKVEFSRKNEQDVYSLSEQIVKVESKRVSSIAFPIELPNGFETDAESLWVFTGEGGVFPKFGDGLSFRKVGEPIAGWHGVATHPIVPDSLDFRVSAYSQDEVGSGKLAVSFYDSSEKNFTVELDGSRISLYQFPSNGVSIVSYEFKKNDPEIGRPVRFLTNKDEKLLKIYFGNKKVFEVRENFDSLWRFALWVKSDNMPKEKAFKSLSIQYPKYILPKK